MALLLNSINETYFLKIKTMENSVVLSGKDKMGTYVKIAVMALVACVVIVGAVFLVKALMPTNVDNAPLQYIAVQEKAGKSWSIMDADGNIVVSEEYSSDDEVSIVSPDGAYWVQSHKSGKYSLFSVDSPDKPLTDAYDQVTRFFGEIAYAANNGEQIVVINTSGEVIATLPKEVKTVSSYSADNDRAAFVSQDGKYGYLNGEGEVVLKAEYTVAYDFHQGLAIVSKDSIEDEFVYLVIDTEGNVKCDIDTEKYDLVSFYYSEGLIPVIDKDKEGVVFLNEDGEVVEDYSRKYTIAAGFIDGYCVVVNEDNEYGVINKDGEEIIRLGKFEELGNLGKGIFLAEKDDAVGVIDAEGNTVIDFKYDGGSYLNYCRIGDNFILERENSSAYVLLNRAGEKISQSKIADISLGLRYSSVTYVDVDKLAERMVEGIGKEGFTPISDKVSVADVMELYNKETSDVGRYDYTCVLQESAVGDYTVNLSLRSYSYLLEEMSHYVQRSSGGWYTYNERVSDGFKWADNSYAFSFEVTVSVYDDTVREILKGKVESLLEGKGFDKVDENVYEAASESGFYPTVTVEDDGYSELKLSFAPFVEMSYNSCAMEDYE